MEFSGKVVLITGASRGIGRAIAHAFAHEGARIAVHYHTHAEAAASVREGLAGGPHQTFQADLSDRSASMELLPAVVRAMGSVDILVNNAGIYDLHPVLTTDPTTWSDTWLRTMDVNLSSPALLSFLAAREMVARGGGSIINISSRGAFRGEPDAPGYGATKAGLNALSQSLAKALAPHGVYVFSLAPGWVETDMGHPYLHGEEGNAFRNQSPLGRAAQPEEIARVVLFLASPRSAYLTGSILDVNGASYLRT
jgi:3-oxoacyl-[acyl-carrier protein] reductase